MKSRNFKSEIMALIATIILIFLDQFTKQIAVSKLSAGVDYVLIPGVLQFHYLENTGAAFSLLENKMILFYILTPILCILMGYLYHKLPDEKKYFGMHLILIILIAGAIGNFIDRILYHYVIDFIYFSLINFPVFNVADIYVTCSVFVLFILILFVYSEDELSTILDSLKFWKK